MPASNESDQLREQLRQASDAGDGSSEDLSERDQSEIARQIWEAGHPAPLNDDTEHDASGSDGTRDELEALARAEPLDHSPPVDEILTEVPGWLVRSGIGMIGLATLAFLALAWFVSYPEIVDGEVVVTTTHPVLPVIAESSGELTLLVADDERVERDEPLGYLRRAALYDDVMRVATLVERVRDLLDRGGTGDLETPLPPVNRLELGELESAYTRLVQAYENYVTFFRDDIRTESVRALQDQLRFLESQTETLERQLQLQAEELEIARDKHERLEKVLEEGAISAVDFRESEIVLLGAEQAVVGLRGSLHNQRIAASQLRQQGMELRHQHRETSRSLTAELGAALEELSAQIASWRHHNVLRAPSGGVVSLFAFWHDGEFVTTGDEVMTILPEGDVGELVGKVSLPRAGAGRVEVGQRARIKLARYPYDDFGAIPAEVRSITPVAREDRYIVHVSFPQELETTYGHRVELRHEMTGEAEIFTEERRLLERIFSQLRSLIDQVN